MLILGILLFPVYWMVNVSLQQGGAAAMTPWLPIDITLHGYAKAFQDQGGHLLTSLIVASGSVVFSLLVAAPAAYALAVFRVRWANAVLLAILVSQMIPGIVVANALYGAYTKIGLLNSILGLILADSSAGIPFSILILNAFMRSMPLSVLEAARIDGAGPLRTLVSVVLPMSRNSIVTAGLFTFLFSWSDFLFALTLTTTDDVRPVTLGLYVYISGFISDWSSVMATSVLASIPTIVLLVFAQRYIAAGTTAGAVK
ncbi:ABC transporter permease subunit [Pleomorphomonas sp. JP5]|uniref:carbohydrate ABC transporter permease n=1 Tax=Pleomorphomonas sp. JP5 TaxID=2942998 RepID=UPI002044A3DC|nr:ABC transporter permease subunit [Pleomorphomonas sp. JP5]MCM5558978.1 carbohydrate ABC transporter permease [Pleomorphomonas sp. JP5]